MSTVSAVLPHVLTSHSSNEFSNSGQDSKFQMMVEQWKDIRKDTIRKIYKNYYMDFLYFNYTFDDFISLGKEDDGSLKDVKRRLRNLLMERSSFIRWKDTNHCQDSYKKACQFVEIEKNFVLVHDFRLDTSCFESLNGN